MDAGRAVTFVGTQGARALVALCLLGGSLSAAQAAPADVFVVADASAAAQASRLYRDLFWLAGQTVALGLPALLLFTGLGVRLRTRLDKLTGGRRLTTASLYAVVYAALALAASLPISAVRHVVAELFGLATLGWSTWAASQAQQAWPILAAALVLGWAPYLLFARSPRSWPIWAGVFMIGAAALALLAQPWWHTLRPVTDPQLKSTIVRLSVGAGAPDTRFALRVAERREPCGSASVLGLGPTKVLVLDTGLLRHHPRREVAQTVAHELKHYTRHDDLRALLVAVAGIVSGLAVLFYSSAFALRVGAARLGFDDLADPASLPLLALLLTVFGLAGGAAFHTVGRPIEQEADRFALELTHDNVAQAAQMQRHLSCSTLKDPDVSWIQRTFERHHPSPRERIIFARDYRPWETGGAEVYSERFR